MKTSTSLCFTAEGLINPQALRFVKHKEHIDTVVLVGDGSEQAFERIKSFCEENILTELKGKDLYLCKTPRHEMRVDKGDGDLSDPHFLYESNSKEKWFCGKVAAPHFNIAITDITSSNKTQTQLDREAKEALCFLAYRMWQIILLVEERLAFPAVAIDLMTKYTYNLHRNTIDVELLRKETGLTTLSYNPDTDMLQIEITGEVFVVKLSILNEVYGTLILPLFRSLKGRRLNILVSVQGQSDQVSEDSEMTYGQLGRLIDTMKIYIRERDIDADHPINKDDLIEWAKRVKIHDESCIMVSNSNGESISEIIDRYKSDMVFRSERDNLINSEYAA